MPSLVRLTVYDLREGFQAANIVMKAVGTGVYHTGVELYGKEYSYGGGKDSHQGGRTGVFKQAEPRNHRVHKFKQTIEMGETSLSEHEVDEIIRALKPEWLVKEYKVLTHSCVDFSNDFCKRLGVGAVPGWVKSAAGLGACVTEAVTKDLPAVIPELVKQGKRKRGASSDDKSFLGDIALGAASAVADSACETFSELLRDGKKARNAAEEEDYQFGDLTRGYVSRVSQQVQTCLAEGKQARDASSSDSYEFGDFVRGMVAGFARK